MKLLNVSTGHRETYKIKLETSLLWEAALGIAAITHEKLRSSLEKDNLLEKAREKGFSEELNKELAYLTEHNTWKALLQLLHELPEHNLESFQTFIETQSEIECRYHCLPYLGKDMEQDRHKASNGDGQAVQNMINSAQSNPFFPAYIAYIAEVHVDSLKQHLISVLSSWIEEVIEPHLNFYENVLNRDLHAKQGMLNNLEPEAFVQWATGGMDYPPEPSVTHVLLIPHYSYRPWTIAADLPSVKVFYYPVSNESLSPNDPLTPDQFLTLKYKALGDENRLKAVKLLSQRDMTLQELSETLQIAKTTLHHHLTLLKSARLITSEKTVYRLNQGAINALGPELNGYIDQ